MDFLIGSITGLLLITLFRFFEKKRVKKLGKTTFLFFLYVVACSVFMHASEVLGMWLAVSIMLYAVLDDMKTKTLNIYFPLIATLLFLLFLEKPYFFLYSFFFFFSFLFFIKLTKERILGEGDAYLFLPLSVLLLTNLPAFEWYFVAIQWLLALLLSALLAAVIGIPYRLVDQQTTELAFGPFLVVGSLLIYNGSPWVFSLFSYLLIAVVLLYVGWLGKWIVSYIREKRKK